MTILRKPPKKIGVVDKQAIGLALEVAAVAVDPEEYNYRTVFREMMPKLYVMRQRGMSFTQLHRILNQTNFPITASTLRTYYNECMLEMLDECQKYFKRMERLIEGAEKTIEADRTEEIRATKSALQTARTTEAMKRATLALGAISASSSGVDNGASMVPLPDPKAAQTGGQMQRPDPLLGSGMQSTLATPAPLAERGALPRANTTEAPALDAPVHAAPQRCTVNAAQTLPSRPETAESGSAKCLTNPVESQIEVLPHTPNEVLSDALLEHPAIPGLLLDRSQRLFKGRLEYVNSAGAKCIEKGTETMNRRDWKAAIPPSVGRTSGDFVELDTTIIGRRKKG
ncbi:hypothetical protein P9281_34575 [Caballeronia sp. LP003]|uniref:hypothetical protein n=1 Tax=Caballeronia sp. LP003 TaxID=3038551 RepID=UPI002858A779|nr:hypothetical protein [Caballeronia sp. LP003]MDR5791674.1 hypothetical protein [Caballeronia sp. LP003]